MPFGNAPDVSGFLDKLDLVGKNPLTYIAFLMLVLGWVGAWYFFHKRVYPKILEKIRHDQRYSALQLLVLGLPDNITDNRLKILRWRYLIVAYGMTLVVFLILAGLFAYYWTRPSATADQEARLRRIEEVTLALHKMQEDRQALIGGVVALRKHVTASASPEIRSKAEELQGLIDEFLTKFDRTTLPEPAQRRLAMAEAEAAFARGEFQKPLDLVDAKGSEQLIRQGTAALAEGVNGTRLRAWSHCQLRQWKNAAAELDLILDTPLGSEYDRILLAFCYDSEGQEGKALALYELVIRTLTARGPDRSEKEDIFLGNAHFTRAMVWNRREDYARAAADYKEAASVLDGARLTPLYLKAFGAFGSCVQQFNVAQSCLARLTALVPAGAPNQELAGAAAETVRRFRTLAANPNLPAAVPPVPDGPPPLDRRAVDELLSMSLFFHATFLHDLALESSATPADRARHLTTAESALRDAIKLFDEQKKKMELEASRELLAAVVETRAKLGQWAGEKK